MFNINDIVMYGLNGMCKITGIEEKNLTGTKKNYLVLTPLNGDNSTYFVPLDNKNLLEKIRKILSKDEINSLIDSMPKENAIWIENERDRKTCYKQILTDGDHSKLIRMIKAIYFKKTEREENGKKLHIADEYFLKEAQKRLYDEFRYVLNLSEEDVVSYIFNRIENNTNTK